MTRELTVKVDGLSDAIQDILKEYGEEVDKIIDVNVKKVKDLTIKQLKATSPVGKATKGTKYRDGWTSRTVKGRVGKTVEIYNKKGQLTHLLEYGHYKFNQHGGPYEGRARAFPHIKKAQEFASNELLNSITKDLEKLR